MQRRRAFSPLTKFWIGNDRRGGFSLTSVATGAVFGNAPVHHTRGE
jgi:hypothetical protein